jgi:uncharacterized cupin superfamily protein
VKPGKTRIFTPSEVAESNATRYPEAFRAGVEKRHVRRLADHAGLQNFGVNLVRMEPGAISSQRHWHTKQDEFVYMLEGELVLETDAGPQVLKPGMCAGFPAASGDGHRLVNRSPRDAVFLVVGDRLPGDQADYPDIDMQFRRMSDGAMKFTRKDGTPY